MTAPNLNWIANYIWGIADEVLRDVYVRGKYRDVILPMTVLRRLDAVLEPTKRAVLDMKATLDAAGVTNQDAALRQAAGQAFHNTSEFTLRDLRARAGRQQLRADFVDYLDGFSPNVQDILDNFEFRNQIPRLDRADALGSLIEKLTSPDINLGPDPVMDTDGAVRHPGLDNHGMGTVFEELIRRFNEENNEEAGEHFTPRDAVTLMARLVFQPIADRIESGTYLLYDGACGTGGKKGMNDHRFLIEHAGDPEYSLVTRSSDGQLLFLANKLSKMKRDTPLGSRIAEVHNGSSLFTGSAGQGESNIRRWIIENDWLEAIVALPLNMFYNTGIATYVWVLTNRKPEHRRGKVQLIDATKWFRPLRKNLGKKNCELGPEDIKRICLSFLDLEETEESRVFDNEAFGYWKVTVERPLRLRVDLSEERREAFFDVCIEAGEVALGEAVHDVGDRLGAGPHRDFNRLLDEVKPEMTRHGVRMIAKRKKLLQTALAERDEVAEPVVKKVHRRGAVAAPSQGLFEVGQDRRARVVEYEPDAKLRDTEQIPLQQECGIEGFLRCEVLPYAPDAWYAPQSVKIGYEISFNRYFYKPEPMRTLDEIRADIATVERETEGLLEGLVGVGVGGTGSATASWGAADPWTTGGLAVREPPPRAAKLRIYMDTSVIGGCADERFRGPSRRLIQRAERGEVTLVVSDATLRELEPAPRVVREVLEAIGADHLEVIDATEEIRILAARYIEAGALTEKSRKDAEHIAAATVAGVSVVASWNFRHMVNLWRIRCYNEVNRQMGHAPIDIRSPRELENDE